MQNGIIRIVGASGYVSVPFGCGEVAAIVREWCHSPGHELWADDISISNTELVDATQLTSPGRLTDTYLLALAVSRGAKLATLDRRLSPAAVRGGAEALHIVG